MYNTNLALLLAEFSTVAIVFWKYEDCEDSLNDALQLLGITMNFEGKLGKRTKW